MSRHIDISKQQLHSGCTTKGSSAKSTTDYIYASIAAKKQPARITKHNILLLRLLNTLHISRHEMNDSRF
jgi:hypothetical protein